VGTIAGIGFGKTETRSISTRGTKNKTANSPMRSGVIRKKCGLGWNGEDRGTKRRQAAQLADETPIDFPSGDKAPPQRRQKLGRMAGMV
jgi:hypothetical protein